MAAGGELFDPPSVGRLVYALRPDRWEPVSELPTARHGHGLLALGDSLYAVGGAAQAGARGTLATVDRLSPV